MLQPTTATRRDIIATNAILGATLLIAAVGTVTIGGAWYFQYGLGLAPCPLCLQQRWPYYVAIPLAFVVALGAKANAPRAMLRAGLVIIVLAMLVGAGLGLYHAGVEWKWWEGPTDCAGAGFSPGGAAGGLLKRMQETRVVRCDEAAWRDPLIGLSLAGYNVLISLALAIVALVGFKQSGKV
ncbi:disulfide bond formation protein B [Variibacter gotjawalensis]|uniref:Disulfide bond formation protein B n=1 Tax=Variibacter gotjawalensis TaxID=1333996 RepID=A0A0S3PPW4_9BRAD|nr:disulfide bond formation protein B [Variibacter gotjawalensis]NIK48315.1 disulfide bond formation protein DsbB [Variibacter gotjawalensis]RZS50187.1 disulfide bond formation protein DsbB [Variibacter gotjawalensis]BAT58017.1 disulfide bond formation protein B [Variibacter gotjawalensis]